MIAEVEAEQHRVAEPAARHRLAIASVLANEVFFGSFRNRREIAGYLGLTSWTLRRMSRRASLASRAVI
ncbi:hypothetical protein ACETIH_22585 [Microvirga arabica]|uniref:HTH araC/xylS-type domain-containing protein n=1 Tax=Microvirga arabica TaxID=1128671 RepID=A0ABV6YDR8_9HYPH